MVGLAFSRCRCHSQILSLILSLLVSSRLSFRQTLAQYTKGRHLTPLDTFEYAYVKLILQVCRHTVFEAARLWVGIAFTHDTSRPPCRVESAGQRLLYAVHIL